MAGFPPSYPPPNSGIPPAAPQAQQPPQVPGMQFVGYDANGQPQYAPVQPQAAPPAYPPQAPPAAPYAAPPAAAPPYGAPPAAPYGAPPAAPYGAPAPGYGAPAGDLAFGEVAWSGGIQIAGTYVIRLEDIEAGVSGNNNEKIVFNGVVVQPQGAVQVNTKHVWSYVLTEKAIGKLGRDVVNAGVNGQTRYPRESRALAAALLNELRGATLVVRIEEQRDGNGFNTSIVSRYNASGPAPQTAPPQAPAPAAAPPAPAAAPPPQTAPPAGAPPAVSFPAGPPAAPPPGSGFGAV